MAEKAPRSRKRRYGLQIASLVVLSALSVLGAPSSLVRLGEVGVSVGDRRELTRELRSVLDAEISGLDLAKIESRERYVLSANLLRLESAQAEKSVRASCEVSVVLRRQNGNILHAMIKGRAIAEEGKSDMAQKSALRAAVHSAVRRVPQALASARP